MPRKRARCRSTLISRCMGCSCPHALLRDTNITILSSREATGNEKCMNNSLQEVSSSVAEAFAWRVRLCLQNCLDTLALSSAFRVRELFWWLICVFHNFVRSGLPFISPPHAFRPTYDDRSQTTGSDYESENSKVPTSPNSIYRGLQESSGSGAKRTPRDLASGIGATRRVRKDVNEQSTRSVA